MTYADMWTNNFRCQLLKAAETPETPKNKLKIHAPPTWLRYPGGRQVRNKSRLNHEAIPATVTHLDISGIYFDDQYRVYIPDSVKWLDISHTNYGQWFFYIPDTVETLVCQGSPYSEPFHVSYVPSGLKVLDLSGNDLTLLPDLPDTLEVLILNNCRLLKYLPKRLPTNLRVLDVRNCDRLTTLPTDVPECLKEVWADGCTKIDDWLWENGYKWGVGSYWATPKFLRQMHEGRDEIAQERAQKRCRALRQEIVAAAYHPRRVERWLEERGWDILEEMMG